MRRRSACVRGNPAKKRWRQIDRQLHLRAGVQPACQVVPAAASLLRVHGENHATIAAEGVASHADQGNARLRCGILVEPLHIGLGQRMVLRRRIPVVELNPVYAEGLQAWKDRRAFDGRDPFTDRELHGLSRSRRQEP